MVIVWDPDFIPQSAYYEVLIFLRNEIVLKCFFFVNVSKNRLKNLKEEGGGEEDNTFSMLKVKRTLDTSLPLFINNKN